MLADHRIKTMEYSYDLVSGNVHRMSVQTGEADQWHHAYTYDADNRITEVYTSTQTPLLDISYPSQSLTNELAGNSDWTVEANYFYYAHGPLARTELGNELQGLDYIYNLQGWLKGVNATSLDNALDPGGDGTGSFSKDVMAFSLHYYKGDYTPIGGIGITPAMGIDFTNSIICDGVGNTLNLYNGNIRFMQTTLTDIPTGDALPMLNAYKYDQLNRLLESRSYETGLSSNVWNPTAYNNEYRNTFTYDANGNILTQQRYLRNGTTQADSLTYHYLVDGSGNLLRNRLYHVNDAIAGAAYTGDLEDQGNFNFEDQYGYNEYIVENDNNYRYDEEGRLIQDLKEGIQEIVWRVDGKVKRVIFTSESEKNNLEFDYDAFGRRIAKHVLTQGNILVKSTYYILDAQGNQLLTYEHSASIEDMPETFSFQLAERVIYGSSRLGINVNKVDLFADSEEDLLSLELGNKLYEMSNHLGNVLTVINDIKVPYVSDSGPVAYYATIVSTADYSPFGVQLDGRTVSASSYRYGYQGSEKDDEVKGGGNSYTTEFRMLDPRLGRWLSIDPLAAKFPWQSPYCSMDNNPVNFNDPLGEETDKRKKKCWKNCEKKGRYGSRTYRRQVLICKMSCEDMQNGNNTKRYHNLDARFTRLNEKMGNTKGLKGSPSGTNDAIGDSALERDSRIDDHAYRPQSLGYRGVTTDDDGNIVVVPIGQQAGPGAPDPFAPVWTEAAANEANADGFTVTAFSPVNVDENGNILDDVGNIVYQAPPGLDTRSSLVMADENIVRSENKGKTNTVEGSASTDTIVLFKTVTVNGQDIRQREETTNVNQPTRTVNSPVR